MTIRNKLIPVLALSALFSASSQAEIFVGGTLGQTDYDSPIDSATAVELEVGYKVGNYFSAGLSYLNLGKAEYKTDGYTYDLGKVDGFNLSVTGELPLGENFGLYAELGYYIWDAGDGVDGNDINYGVGANWFVSDLVGLNLGYTKYDLDEGGANVLGLGAKFYF